MTEDINRQYTFRTNSPTKIATTDRDYYEITNPRYP